MAITLVRHAMPDVQPGVAPRLWSLTEASREDCVLLAHALPPELAPVVWSSDEPKAAETASIIALRRGLQTAQDSRFREVDRPQVWVEEHRRLAEAYLAGGTEAAWEAQANVVARFAAGVAEAGAHEGDLVVVDHGMALTLWLASLADIDPVPWWRALTFPDAWRLDPATGALEQLFRGTVG